MQQGLIIPYIKEHNRYRLNRCIEYMMYCLKGNVSPHKDSSHSTPYKQKLTNKEFLTVCGILIMLLVVF